MKKFLITLMCTILTTDLFAVCDAGDYETIQQPSGSVTSRGYIKGTGAECSNTLADKNTSGLSAWGWNIKWGFSYTMVGTSKCDLVRSSYICYCKVTKINNKSVTGSWFKDMAWSTSDAGVGCCAMMCPYRCANKGTSTLLNSVTSYPSSLAQCNTCPDASEFYTGDSGTTTPSVSEGSISSSGGKGITSCYAKSGTTFHNDIGTFTFSSNCNYSK